MNVRICAICPEVFVVAVSFGSSSGLLAAEIGQTSLGLLAGISKRPRAKALSGWSCFRGLKAAATPKSKSNSNSNSNDNDTDRRHRIGGIAKC